MEKKFINAFQQIQVLFHQLLDDGKVSPEQAELFDEAQKDIVNFYAWFKKMQDGNIKVELPWDDPEFEKAWILWRDYKKQQFRFTYKPIGEQAALNDLSEISGADMKTAIAIIDKSMKKGWRGLFKLQYEPAAKKPAKTKPGQILQTEKTKDYDGWD